MAGAIHISEQEAARDFGAVMERVRANGQVVVDCADGTEAVICVQPERRTLAESLRILAEREAELGLTVPDPEFASDLEAIHELYNAPMDDSKWG